MQGVTSMRFTPFLAVLVILALAAAPAHAQSCLAPSNSRGTDGPGRGGGVFGGGGPTRVNVPVTTQMQTTSLLLLQERLQRQQLQQQLLIRQQLMLQQLLQQQLLQWQLLQQQLAQQRLQRQQPQPPAVPAAAPPPPQRVPPQPKAPALLTLEERAQIKLSLAKKLHENGLRQDAQGGYQEVIEKFPYTLAAEEAGRLLSTLPPAPTRLLAPSETTSPGQQTTSPR